GGGRVGRGGGGVRSWRAMVINRKLASRQFGGVRPVICAAHKPHRRFDLFHHRRAPFIAAPTLNSRSRYFSVALIGEKSIARRFSASRSCSATRASAIASASAETSLTGTRRPHRPFSRISAGPDRQSVETTGTPQASASIITLPKPS